MGLTFGGRSFDSRGLGKGNSREDFVDVGWRSVVFGVVRTMLELDALGMMILGVIRRFGIRRRGKRRKGSGREGVFVGGGSSIEIGER